jgi:hypothetical protein
MHCSNVKGLENGMYDSYRSVANASLYKLDALNLIPLTQIVHLVSINCLLRN